MSRHKERSSGPIRPDPQQRATKSLSHDAPSARWDSRPWRSTNSQQHDGGGSSSSPTSSGRAVGWRMNGTGRRAQPGGAARCAAPRNRSSGKNRRTAEHAGRGALAAGDHPPPASHATRGETHCTHALAAAARLLDVRRAAAATRAPRPQRPRPEHRLHRRAYTADACEPRTGACVPAAWGGRQAAVPAQACRRKDADQRQDRRRRGARGRGRARRVGRDAGRDEPARRDRGGGGEGTRPRAHRAEVGAAGVQDRLVRQVPIQRREEEEGAAEGCQGAGQRPRRPSPPRATPGSASESWSSRPPAAERLLRAFAPRSSRSSSCLTRSATTTTTCGSARRSASSPRGTR